MKRIKGQATEWEKTFAKDISEKRTVIENIQTTQKSTSRK